MPPREVPDRTWVVREPRGPGWGVVALVALPWAILAACTVAWAVWGVL